MSRYLVTVVVTQTIEITHRVFVDAADVATAERAVDANFETFDWTHDGLPSKKLRHMHYDVQRDKTVDLGDGGAE